MMSHDADNFYDKERSCRTDRKKISIKAELKRKGMIDSYSH